MAHTTPRSLTTKDLQDGMNVKQESIRTQLSKTGSYFGVIPLKSKNGRLLWPANSIELLTQQEENNNNKEVL
jgi:hypothetical protein